MIQKTTCNQILIDYFIPNRHLSILLREFLVVAACKQHLILNSKKFQFHAYIKLTKQLIYPGRIFRFEGNFQSTLCSSSYAASNAFIEINMITKITITDTQNLKQNWFWFQQTITKISNEIIESLKCSNVTI